MAAPCTSASEPGLFPALETRIPSVALKRYEVPEAALKIHHRAVDHQEPENQQDDDHHRDSKAIFGAGPSVVDRFLRYGRIHDSTSRLVACERQLHAMTLAAGLYQRRSTIRTGAWPTANDPVMLISGLAVRVYDAGQDMPDSLKPQSMVGSRANM